MVALKSWAVRVAQRRGAKRGKVALARKLAVVLHRMWFQRPISATPPPRKHDRLSPEDHLHYRVVQAGTAMRSTPLGASTRTSVTPLSRSALLVLGSHDVTAARESRTEA